ncbi:uncharacterized protein LOC125281385 isoform X2 [Ursus arctos]|uniref:uncharacterized protein LOC125281385 isoform X2 n=1 Tax=Ursus arctos TaxID=9644 RepID=UPI0025497FA2|nr:uncharacterized protein LOC125281385 isoform X2 [Ursus arctos]
MAGAPSATLSKTRRRSFRKKRDKPKTEPWKGLPPEDISVPNGVDLLGLPQLCFPGGVYVASEPKEDCVHFLVLTDVCGNRSMPWLPSTPDPRTTSRVSTTARRTGSHPGRPRAWLAAADRSRCAWSPSSPTTTPSRTACPGEPVRCPRVCEATPGAGGGGRALVW